MHSSSEMLDKARFAFVMGRAGEARQLLERLLRREPGNGDAWYLLAQVTDDPSLRADCYERAAAAKSVPQPDDLPFAPRQPAPAAPPPAPQIRPLSDPFRTRRPRRPVGVHPRLFLVFLSLTVVLGATVFLFAVGPRGALLTPRQQGLGLVRPRADGHPAEEAIQRGNARFDAGDFAAARAEYSTAISREPVYAVGYYNRGAAYRAEGAYASAIPDFTKALALEPGYDKVYYYRGEAYVLSGQPRLALADLSTAAERDAEALFALYLLAAAHHELGMNEAAMNDLRAAADRYSGLPLGYFSLGMSSKIRGERVQALEYFRLFLERTKGYTALEILSRGYVAQLREE